MDFANYVASILISLVLGLAGFLLAYKLFDRLTPGVNFSDQLNDERVLANQDPRIPPPAPAAVRVTTLAQG